MGNVSHKVDAVVCCADIDECTEKSSGCEQECTNTVGTFECACMTGFSLNNDNKICKQG